MPRERKYVFQQKQLGAIFEALRNGGGKDSHYLGHSRRTINGLEFDNDAVEQAEKLLVTARLKIAMSKNQIAEIYFDPKKLLQEALVSLAFAAGVEQLPQRLMILISREIKTVTAELCRYLDPTNK